MAIAAAGDGGQGVVDLDDIEVGSDGKVLGLDDECTVVSDDYEYESGSVVALPESPSGDEASKATKASPRPCRRMALLSLVALGCLAALFFGVLIGKATRSSENTSQIVSRSENADVGNGGSDIRQADALDYVSNDEDAEDPDDEDAEDDCQRFLESFRDIDLTLLNDFTRGYTDEMTSRDDEDHDDEDHVVSKKSVGAGFSAEDWEVIEASYEKRRRCETRLRKRGLRH